MAKQQKKKQVAEQKRIAEEKRLKKLAQEKIERDKKEAEAKRKQQHEAELQKALDAEEKQAQQEEDAQKKRDAAKKKADEKAKKAQQDQDDQKQISSYEKAIKGSIQSVFNISGLSKDLSCEIYIRILKGGKVAEVAITRSSGNKLFDQRAENAVYAASPLPVPDEARLLQKMSTIEFTFKP